MKATNSQLNGVHGYLAHECGSAAATIDAYLRDLELVRVYGQRLGKSLLELSLDDYRGFIQQQTLEGNCSATIARRLAAVRAFLRWAETTGQPTKDIQENLESPKQENRLPEILNQGQVAALLAAPDRSTPLGIRDAAILELLYATGIRATEICQLLLSDINLAQRHLRVKGKGGKDRVVPFHPQAASAVARYLEQRPATGAATLFVSATGRPLERVSLWRLVTGYAAKAGIDKNTYPHILRHCFASHMLSGGADLRVVQDILGHSNLGTTQTYTHVDTAHLKKVHALLGR